MMTLFAPISIRFLVKGEIPSQFVCKHHWVVVRDFAQLDHELVLVFLVNPVENGTQLQPYNLRVAHNRIETQKLKTVLPAAVHLVAFPEVEQTQQSKQLIRDHAIRFLVLNGRQQVPLNNPFHQSLLSRLVPHVVSQQSDQFRVD